MTDSPRSDSFRQTLVDALGTVDLRRLQLSWALTSFGQWAFFVILAVYAYEQGGATAVGVAALVRMVPAGLTAPLAGLVIDRSSRRDVLLGTDVARVVALAGVAAAVAAAAPLGVVLVLSAVYTVLQTAHVPAQAALFPALATTPRQLAASNAVSSSVENAGVLVGSLLGGVLVAATSAESAFLVTAGLYAVAAWPLARIPRDPIPAHREKRDEGEERPLAELVSGFGTVIGEPSLRLVVGLLAAGSFVEGAVDVLIVLLAIDLLDIGGAGVGWLNAAWGVGGLTAGAVAISLLGRGRLAAGLASGGLLAGTCLLLLALLPDLLVAVAIALFVLIGLGYGLIEITGLTLLQRMTSDEVLGRAFAVVESGYWLMTGLGAIVAPLLVELWGVRGALVALGVLLPALVALRWRALTRLEAGTAVPEEAFRLLRSVPMFAPLPLGTIESLSQRLTPVEAGAGTAVVREGEHGDHFYVIAAGEFDVTRNAGAFPSLAAGDVFGEIALLRDVPRTATVTARTDGRLYALDRDAFLTAVSGHRFTTRTAASIVDERSARAPTQRGVGV
jgi:MFS family permease